MAFLEYCFVPHDRSETAVFQKAFSNHLGGPSGANDFPLCTQTCSSSQNAARQSDAQSIEYRAEDLAILYFSPASYEHRKRLHLASCFLRAYMLLVAQVMEDLRASPDPAHMTFNILCDLEYETHKTVGEGKP